MKSMKGLLFVRKTACIFLSILTFVFLLEAPVSAAAQVPAAMADSSVKLLREALRTAKKDENILISPDSIFSAMAMVEYGAAGTTLQEMEAVLGNVSAARFGRFLSGLHQRLTGSSAYTYSPANSVWYKKGEVTLKKGYLNKMAKSFQADIYAAPFNAATVKQVNAWVNKKTYGKIPSIIKKINPQDRVILVNSVYFKGDWAEPYMVSTERAFTKASGQRQKVEMMSGTENEFVSINGGRGFVKNYRGGKVAFMALLPPSGTSVKEYAAALTGSDLIKGYKTRKTENVIVHTRMPEFTYDYSASMKKALIRLGIKKAFSARANFSKMSKTKMYIDDVFHKTHIEVNKTGTEAAAATAVFFAESAAMPDPDAVEKKVYLNRPFIYAIIDTQTGG